MTMDTIVKCPACNKADQAGDACTRCGCELTRLHAVVHSATTRLDAARRALLVRDYRTALIEATQSWRLCHLRESAGVAFVAAAGLGDTVSTLHWLRRSSG